MNDLALNIIKQFEGLKLQSYQDIGGVWTIGYGTTYVGGLRVRAGMTCTESEAEAWLTSHIMSLSDVIESLVHVSLTDTEMAALISLVYNIGELNFMKSTLLKLINEFVNNKTIGEEFLKWDHVGGVVSQGLLNRRQAEKALWES
jgi:lysozyme